MKSLDDKKVVNAWAMYDWANSVYPLVITSTIFPIYYSAITKNENSGVVDFFGRNYINTALYSYAISFSFFCFATKGVASNDTHNSTVLGKAGRARLSGYKPVVRGVAQNPVDHPHGGGEGKKSKSCFPKTAWGKMLHWRRTGIRYINIRKTVIFNSYHDSQK